MFQMKEVTPKSLAPIKTPSQALSCNNPSKQKNECLKEVHQLVMDTLDMTLYPSFAPPDQSPPPTTSHKPLHLNPWPQSFSPFPLPENNLALQPHCAKQGDSCRLQFPWQLLPSLALGDGGSFWCQQHHVFLPLWFHCHWQYPCPQYRKSPGKFYLADQLLLWWFLADLQIIPNNVCFSLDWIWLGPQSLHERDIQSLYMYQIYHGHGLNEVILSHPDQYTSAHTSTMSTLASPWLTESACLIPSLLLPSLLLVLICSKPWWPLCGHLGHWLPPADWRILYQHGACESLPHLLSHILLVGPLQLPPCSFHYIPPASFAQI